MTALYFIKKYSIWLIFALALFLRVVRLGDYPHSLNRDELAVAYNAYSVLETHKGEHGEGPWPLNFISFGDYKMPGLVYFLIPFIKFLGLNNFAVRLPSALLGSGAVLLSYLLLKKIFDKRKHLAILASLFLATAPYHIHGSRMAIEPQIAFIWQLIGTLILLTHRGNWRQVFSLPFFLLAIFTYNSPVFIVLPLSLLILYFYKKDFFYAKANKATLFFILGLILVYGSYFLVFQGINRQKSEATILNRDDFVTEINANIKTLHDKGWPVILARLFYNKPLKVSQEFGKRYFSIYNPSFLFFSGDKEPFFDLSPAGIPNLYPHLLPLFLLGLCFLVKHFDTKENRFILFWLLVTGITSGFVNISPNTTKLFDFQYLIIIIAALGLEELFKKFQSGQRRVVPLAIIIYIFALVHFSISYFYLYPIKAPKLWLPGLDQVIAYSKELDYDYFFVSREGGMDLAYVYFAFYMPFDPADFMLVAKRERGGFNRVEHYGNFVFETPISNLSLSEHQEYKDKYGRVLCISEYEKKLISWEDVKVFYFKGEPLWILQKI